MIGSLITHKRYGKAKVTHIWKKIINPVDHTTKLSGLTFELLTAEGKHLFNKDRSYNGTLNGKPLPRCYESDLTKLKVVDYENNKS